ncbi:MAG TPA: HAMP domain-containing sensor histidine kinase [Spirochaetia bacterium]|nr:HAMP domain-containing sensor histidine kinase [Spirochaetia bacterium]
MKLRTQFVLLVGGIIAVPFLVAAFVLLVQYRMDRDRQPLPNYGMITQWIRRQVPWAVNHHEYAALRASRPPGLDIMLVDGTNTISFSTIPEIGAGISATSGALLEYIRRNSDSFHFQIDATRNPEASGNALMILKVPRIRPEEQTFRNQFLAIVTYSAIALLVFSSLMSFLILRSLNRSILKLEGATRRIAEGDLDFELSARGNDQISSLTRSFDSMRRALKEEYARRSRFIMGVSHDLRTPLTLIQGYVEAINDGLAPEPDSQKRYLSIILDKTRALEGMITDLIEFVRMETGQWRMTHRDVTIQTFLTENARRFAEDAFILKRDFGWSINIPPEAAVRMDAGLFSRALENLVGNAIRYTSPEGKINLSARLDGEHVLMSISDTGIGIPPEDLSRIFDPFYRGTNSRREQGFGLGLTTVKSIIESHGWAIGVSSQLGQGTTFTIRMPLATSTPPAAGAAA